MVDVLDFSGLPDSVSEKESTRRISGKNCEILETRKYTFGTIKSQNDSGYHTESILGFHGASVRGVAQAYSDWSASDGKSSILYTGTDSYTFSPSVPENCTKKKMFNNCYLSC